MFNLDDRKPNYNFHPKITINNAESIKGYSEIASYLNQLKLKYSKDRIVITFDYYHGIDSKEVEERLISKLDVDLVIDTSTALHPPEVLNEKFKMFITEHRVNGVIFPCHAKEFFDPNKIMKLNERIKGASGLIILHGTCASVVQKGDILINGIITKEEVISRIEQGLDNWGAKNYKEDRARKEKRSAFLDFPVLDKHKRHIIKDADYVIDFSADNPVLVNGETYRKAIYSAVRTPFSLKPLLTDNIWGGGKWLAKVLGAKTQGRKVSFLENGAFAKQSLTVEIGGNTVNIPSNDLISLYPKEILGKKIFHTYGYRCPLEVIIVDTFGGENSSLQVHPTAGYNQDNFNHPYSHNESYYILDTADESITYFGMRDGVSSEELIKSLESAQATGNFDVSKYINCCQTKNGDYFLIPAGLVHAFGKGTVCVEIDTNPITTFKMWDWNRVGEDGKPRPIDLELAKEVIQEEFKESWVNENLISKPVLVESGEGWRKECIGREPLGPATVNRYYFNDEIQIESNDSIALYVIISGEEAVIESNKGLFEPFVFHFCEAVFVPAGIEKYKIRTYGESESKEICLLQIYKSA